MEWAHMCCGVSSEYTTKTEVRDQWDVSSQQEDGEQMQKLPACVFACKTLRPSCPVSEDASRRAEESSAASAQLLGKARTWIVLAEYDKIPNESKGEMSWQLSEPVARSDLLLLPNLEAEVSKRTDEWMISLEARRRQNSLNSRTSSRNSAALKAEVKKAINPILSVKRKVLDLMLENFGVARKRMASWSLSFYQAITCKPTSADDDASKLSASSPATSCGARLLHWLLFLTAVIIASVVIIGNQYGDDFMIYMGVPMRGDPSYLVDFLGGKCLHLKRTFGSFLLEIESQNKRAGWIEVILPARSDQREVRALYFQAAARSPRVVLAHGVDANYLDSTVQTTAHFLRLMNISSLVPNLRSRRGDGRGKHVREWRDQYLDLLGAWDYAVTDPKGQLGGPLSASLVGMMGFEFGAFAVQAAFGREPGLQSVLFDGAVHDVRVLLDQVIDREAPLSLGWLFKQQAWSRCEARAARKLHKDATDVAEHLMARRAAGTVGIIHSVDDRIVPIEQHNLLLETIGRGHASSLKVIMEWYPSFRGDSNCKERREIHLDRPQEYQSFLCEFWGAAFSGHAVLIRGSKPNCGWS